MAGYSGTPLAKKLGLRPGMQLLVAGQPPDYENWLGDTPVDFRIVSRAAKVSAAHLFVTEAGALEAQLQDLRRRLDPAGFLWVSWPKKASKVATDITEQTIRDIALPMGFVDVKVCAVTEVWSGLKLVIRKSERR
jgi:hypothetical protein